MADSEYYRMLKENPPKKSKKVGHNGNWSLVYQYLGVTQVVITDKPYALLVSAKKNLELSLIKGKYVIIPYKG